MTYRTLSLVAMLSGAAASTASAQTQVPATAQAQALPSLAPLVESVKSAVVNVDVQARSGRGGAMEGEDDAQDLFDQFFGRRFRPPGRRAPLRQGMGSGFIIDARGLALTNNHVVQGAVAIRVRLDDG